ncbi:hypothetical protein L208DRAFT_1391456 [Tricholoma matsutake]|nr:hypothetical protein L208DRAFT_1391456 [Tricholoma matsutake 945]
MVAILDCSYQALTVYEEQLRDGDAGWAPELLPLDPSTDSSQMDIDALSQETVSTGSQLQLSTQVLQSAAANCEAERQERQKNSNDMTW